MGSRSLFSPFATSVNPYAARNLGNLFGPRLELSPELLALLAPGPQPSNEMFLGTKPFVGRGGLFGSAKRLETQANAQYLLPLIQAQFASNLAAQKEKELIPFRSATELQQRKDLATFEQQEKDKIREEEESRLGTAISQVLANFPQSQVENIFPHLPGTPTEIGIPIPQTRSPTEIARQYIARFGTKTPVNEAIVQGDPRVIQANIGEQMGKEYLPLGAGDRYNPRTGRVIEGPSVTEEMTKSMVATGEAEFAGTDENGNPIYKPVYKEQIRTIRKPSPATQYDLPENITQEELDSIAKPSGASNTGQLLPDIGSSTSNVLNQLNTTLKQPTIQAQPGTTEPKKGFNLLEGFIKSSKAFEEEGKKFTKPKVEKEEPKQKERPKSYPFDYLIEAKRLDKKQAEMFETLIENYKKREKRNPSLEEARTFIQIVIGNKNK